MEPRRSFWCLFQVALLETNPYLLALTIVVSIVHSIFEFLAFKNGEHRGGTLGIRREGKDAKAVVWPKTLSPLLPPPRLVPVAVAEQTSSCCGAVSAG